ncbi:MAG: hypothetical protein WCD76_15810 [Pyrinomonadaceae bacterium]
MCEKESEGTCEACGRPLHGHLGVFESEFYGVGVVVIKETSPRNWICCDACARMLCHACCSNPQSGYCDPCFDAITRERKEMPQRRERHDSPLGAVADSQARIDEH